MNSVFVWPTEGANPPSAFPFSAARSRRAAARVQYVRVARTKGAGKNFFHLNKILVYGKKLY